jgi:group I intron endonuclease
MKTGIYTITNNVTKHIYVGAASNVTKRLNDHLCSLRKNIHVNNYMQNSWNKYGEGSFTFELLEECNKTYLYSQEHYWCNMLNSHNEKYGFNLKPTHPNNISICTEETKKKIKEKATGRKWSDEYKQLFREKKLGIKQSEEQITKSRESKYKKVYQYSLEGEFIREWTSAQHIKKELNIPANNICNCCNNKKSHNTVKGFKWTYINHNEQIQLI